MADLFLEREKKFALIDQFKIDINNINATLNKIIADLEKEEADGKQA